MRIPRMPGAEARSPPDPAHSEADAYRGRVWVVFLEAVDPNGTTHEPLQPGGTTPAPLVRHWDLSGALMLPDCATRTPTRIFDITLPITVAPKSVPALASAGLALSPYQAAID